MFIFKSIQRTILLERHLKQCITMKWIMRWRRFFSLWDGSNMCLPWQVMWNISKSFKISQRKAWWQLNLPYWWMILKMFLFARSIIYFRTPPKINIFGDDLFRPFSTSVWLCLSISLIIIGLLIKFSLVWERRIDYLQLKNRPCDAHTKKKKPVVSILYSILLAFGACCQQGVQ